MKVNAKILGALAALIGLVVLPFLGSREAWLNMMVVILINIGLSQSWNILGGYAGQINLGHAVFFGMGSLVTRWLINSGMHIYCSVFLGAIAPLIIALCIGWFVFKLRGAYFIISMLAIAEIVRILVANAYPSISTLPPAELAHFEMSSRYLLALAVSVGVTAIVYVLNRSKLGLGMQAVREDENTAEATGINTYRVKLIALIVSAFLAGMVGGVFAYYHVSYYPAHTFSPHWTFDALFITYIGGIGTVWGPIIGSVFYVGVRELISMLMPQEIHTIIFGLIFIIVIITKPRGMVVIPTQIMRLFKQAWGNFRRERDGERAI